MDGGREGGVERMSSLVLSGLYGPKQVVAGQEGGWIIGNIVGWVIAVDDHNNVCWHEGKSQAVGRQEAVKMSGC